MTDNEISKKRKIENSEIKNVEEEDNKRVKTLKDDDEEANTKDTNENAQKNEIRESIVKKRTLYQQSKAYIRRFINF